MATQTVLGGVVVLRVSVASNKMSFIAALAGVVSQDQFFIQCMFGVNLPKKAFQVYFLGWTTLLVY
jgi:hypothetical protein